MKRSILKLGKTLNKTQQLEINGGRMSQDCQIYDPATGWQKGWSVEDAQWLYHNESSVTGYCCASC
ncbi:hypothetical protein [uncultured Tenacibaculum sp.]|uniref:hypothetical protein n=1 Tax=uncultured Tenacibaculum sp. TaxID=174713 RepID=UPI002629D650|nr:hypothetical protein [uncultured Tenacibaculum sp.]